MTNEHLDGFLIRTLESVAEGLEQGGHPASAARELRKFLSCVEDRTDEPEATNPLNDLIDALAWLDIWIADGPPTEAERAVVKGFVQKMRERYGKSKVAVEPPVSPAEAFSRLREAGGDALDGVDALQPRALLRLSEGDVRAEALRVLPIAVSISAETVHCKGCDGYSCEGIPVSRDSCQ